MQRAEVEAIARAGMAALEKGDAAVARDAFEKVIASGQTTPPAWIMLAQACRLSGDADAEKAAIEKALALDSGNLRALLMKGDWFARAGDDRAAVAFYQVALAKASAVPSLPPGLIAQLKRAEATTQQVARQYEDYLGRRLADAGFPAEALDPRVDEAVAIVTERKQVFFQQPTSFFFPGLPHRQFYERAEFSWLPALEAAAPAMRAELEALLHDRAVTLNPYVQAPRDRPYNDAHSMLNNPDWAAFYLWKEGELVPEAMARCPRTVEALQGAPIPRIRTRSPMAIFSVLRPGTHIPPHNGMLNTRLICHIPLIVPTNCRLRVGNDTRPVEEGKALIFDDSIEHEAWNDSDETRVVLLFEIWRPELSASERDALTVIFEAINDYSGRSSEGPN